MFRIVDDRAGDAPPALRTYERILVLVIGVEYWLRAIPKWGQLASHYYWLLALATIVCPLTLTRAGRRVGFMTLAASHAVLVVTEFPSTGNHAYLELLLCLLGAFLDPGLPAEAKLYTRAVRWLSAVVIGMSGLQKLAHGLYFHGEYLAYSLRTETFRTVLGPFLDTGEYARLTALKGEVGDGPYRVAFLPFQLMTNGIWLLEIALAPLLCWRRTRHVAVLLAVLLLSGIELGAREVFFGIVFSNALLTFAPPQVHQRLFPAVCVLLLALTLSRLGVLPPATFY